MNEVESYERNGVTIRIVYDDAPESPTTWGWYDIVTFDTRSVTSTSPWAYVDEETGKPNAELAEQLKDGRAFWLDIYEHGGTSYSLHAEGTQDQWDTAGKGGLIILTDDALKEVDAYKYREAAARGYLETYTEWANGEVYGYQIEDADGDDVDSCYGFYGLDYCKEQANEVADDYRIPRRSNPASKVHI